MSDDANTAPTSAEDLAHETLRLLTETSTTAERVAGLRSLGLRVEDIARAAGVGAETVRVWETGNPPRAKHHRLLDRLRYVAALLLEGEQSRARAHSWLTSCNTALGGDVPLEIFAEHSRDVMRAATERAMADYNATHPAPAPVRVDVVPSADGPSPGSVVDSDEIQRLVARGLSIRDIAGRLGISELAARRLIKALKDELGVSTLREAQQALRDFA